jgi:hypothetical protein
VFASGDRVEVRGDVHARDVDVYSGTDRVGAVVFAPLARSARLTVVNRSWLFGGYAPGWRLAAFEQDGRVAAAYSDRWLLAGRIWVGDNTSSLHIPLGLRNWTVRASGAKVLALDRAGWGLSGRVGRLPGSPDDDLLIGFAVAVIWTRVRFRVRPMRSVHVVEGRTDELDSLLEGDLDADVGDEVL